MLFDRDSGLFQRRQKNAPSCRIQYTWHLWIGIRIPDLTVGPTPFLLVAHYVPQNVIPPVSGIVLLLDLVDSGEEPFRARVVFAGLVTSVIFLAKRLRWVGRAVHHSLLKEMQ